MFNYTVVYYCNKNKYHFFLICSLLILSTTVWRNHRKCYQAWQKMSFQWCDITATKLRQNSENPRNPRQKQHISYNILLWKIVCGLPNFRHFDYIVFYYCNWNKYTIFFLYILINKHHRLPTVCRKLTIIFNISYYILHNLINIYFKIEQIYIDFVRLFKV